MLFAGLALNSRNCGQRPYLSGAHGARVVSWLLPERHFGFENVQPFEGFLERGQSMFVMIGW